MTFIQYILEMTCVFVLGFLRADLKLVSLLQECCLPEVSDEILGRLPGPLFLIRPWIFLSLSTVKLPKVLLTFLALKLALCLFYIRVRIQKISWRQKQNRMSRLTFLWLPFLWNLSPSNPACLDKPWTPF